MSYYKAIKITVVLQLLIMSAVLFFVVRGHNPNVIIYYLLVLEFIVMICLIAFMWRLDSEINKILDSYLLDKDYKKLFLNVNNNKIPFMNKLKSTIDHYSEYKNRDNSVKYLDKQRELSTLQSQINPHFLYNTLDTIRGQAVIDDNIEVADMVESLACFFRYGISGKGELVTLREEIANVKNYMMIQKYRFGDRFILDVFIEKEDEVAYDFFVPRLIIQPIIENAIIHGLKEVIQKGKITINIMVTDKNLILTISDNGKGIDLDTLKSLNNKIKSVYSDLGGDNSKNGTGIALKNINKRIKLIFGENYGINVYSSVGFGTDVEIILPINYKRTTDIK